MNIITPEIIFDRFASRLYERWDDLDYIIHAPSGWEKWAQWELFLCFKDELFPTVYIQDDKFLRENKRNCGEHVADIKLEYSYDRRNSKKERTDLFIANKPFILPKIDLDTWRVIDPSFESELREAYKISEFHYVELKTDWWDLNKELDEKKQPVGLLEDIENKIQEDGNKLIKSAWKPCSLIAMSIVTFYKSNDGNDPLGKGKIPEKIKELIKDKKELNLNWLYSHIENNTYLIGAYRTP